ncbi:AGC (cAMP-dependent, cGMP-dependent and protein kinase C) kinase family protein [Actinidia rufa]|uniref:non-specific serine/threonine protein kinase n=1 Tax=Actinidia rufa TaxID=165716 RepID=A0A7J0GRB5_9ERIC|nr:AGC (cAMP-dependent, cGMP-dependent and protein kinase C) kinase family protein [Actinidia rufa]
MRAGDHRLELSRLKVISALGRGAKGVVFLIQEDRNQTNDQSSSNEFEFLALKAILRASIEKNRNCDESEYRRICFEEEVLGCFDHPLLPRLRGVVETDKIVGYAIDYCPGRDLNSLRKKQTEKMFSDDIIRFYAAELVLTLEYLHGLGIVYRDLKPGKHNVVSSVPMKKKNRRILSFKCYNSGISPEDSLTPPELVIHPASSESDSVEKSNSFVGTEEYVAPEIICGDGHDFTVDWWCLGIVLYEMLYGATPFRGSNRKETFYRVLTKSPELFGDSTPLRDLIGRLLAKDPKQRISLEGIKGHDFFLGLDWNQILHIKRPPYIPSHTEVEDTEGNKGIDVESFVQEIFKIGDEDMVEAGKDCESKRSQEKVNDGMWVEGPNQPSKTDPFNVF